MTDTTHDDLGPGGKAVLEALRLMRAEIDAVTAERDDLAKKLAEAVEALRFYADPTYNGYDVCVGDYGLSLTTGCIIKDDGDLARTTLASITETPHD